MTATFQGKTIMLLSDLVHQIANILLSCQSQELNTCQMLILNTCQWKVKTNEHPDRMHLHRISSSKFTLQSESPTNFKQSDASIHFTKKRTEHGWNHENEITSIKYICLFLFLHFLCSAQLCNLKRKKYYSFYLLGKAFVLHLNVCVR